MQAWRKQLEDLTIPYPQKALLAREIKEHVEHFPEESNEALDSVAISELYLLHNTLFFRMLQRLGPKVGKSIEFCFAAAPITALLFYLVKEKYMGQFMHEGGPGMYLILTIGLVLLLRELILIFRLVIVKDHSKKNLRIDSMAVIIGTMALVLLGICGTGLGAYKAASWVEQQNLPVNILIVGLKESITCFVLSACMASLVLLLHFFTRRTLATWKVPETLTN